MPSKTSTLIPAVIMLSLLVLAAACSDLDTGSPTEESKAPAATPRAAVRDAGPAMVEPEELLGSWILVTLDGEPVAAAGESPTFELYEDGEVSGTTGVNRYSTAADRGALPAGRLELGRAATTKRAGPAEAMELERQFLERLGTTSAWSVEGDLLRLRCGDGRSLGFERAPAAGPPS